MDCFVFQNSNNIPMGLLVIIQLMRLMDYGTFDGNLYRKWKNMKCWSGFITMGFFRKKKMYSPPLPPRLLRIWVLMKLKCRIFHFESTPWNFPLISSIGGLFFWKRPICPHLLLNHISRLKSTPRRAYNVTSIRSPIWKSNMFSWRILLTPCVHWALSVFVKDHFDIVKYTRGF